MKMTTSHWPIQLAVLTACGSGGGSPAPAADVADSQADVPEQTDSGGHDAAPADTPVADTKPADIAAQDLVQVDGGSEFGFNLRVPQERLVTCSKYPDGYPGAKTPQKLMDVDYLCTFKHGGQDGMLYVQATPSDCEVIMNATPIFTSHGWVAIGGKVTELQGAGYDWGGNHHNDSLAFDWNGKHYGVYHSSFGFGWRKCQPPDCLQVSPAAGQNPTEDGCTKDRTLPVVCVPMEADGSHKALVDTFKKCAGDPNGP